MKVQKTATLLLPGWDGSHVTQDYDMTFSEVTQVGHRHRVNRDPGRVDRYPGWANRDPGWADRDPGWADRDPG